MSYKSDFKDETGWSCVDTNSKLNTPRGQAFRTFLKTSGVDTIIRYYASTDRPKTLSAAEARLLSEEGFSLLAVFQDNNREPEDFGSENGTANAESARSFAERIGQPEGTTILFAADADFTSSTIKSAIIPYFKSLKSELEGQFRIGAYGSGAVLQALLDANLIEVPWLSMSRGFLDTKEFFYANSWAFRQVPPDLEHDASGISYDRNILKWTKKQLGVFQIGLAADLLMAKQPAIDAILGGRFMRATSADSGEEALPKVTERTTMKTSSSTKDGPGLASTPNAYVTTEGLNIRASPDGNIIGELSIGDPVTTLGTADPAGWQQAMAVGQQGYVFEKYLRKPKSPEIELLLQNVFQEWKRFKKGKAHEKDEPYYKYVGEMWQSIGLNYDGRSVDENGKDVPWSAAFISFVVRRSGPKYANFFFASSHSKFSHDAIQARILNRKNRPFWGYRISETKPELGDIIHRNRGKGKFTFDHAENHTKFESHSDVVVEVTSAVCRVIGGNVGDTVTMRSKSASDDNIQEYDLDSAGYLASGQKVIAVLKNRASETS